MTTSSAGVWLLAARPKTLWAGATPVIVGTAMAVEVGGFHLAASVCALLGALLIQIGTNFANDYSDYVQGADTADRVGPIRVTQAGLAKPASVRMAAGIAFVLAFVAGIYLIVRGGWPILLIGLLSIASGILYTSGRNSLAYLGLGDVFVLIFFGPVAVAGTFYVQALHVTAEAMIAGLGPGLLAVAILLANNIRDVHQDRLAGKRTLVVRFGRAFGTQLYLFCLIGASAVPVVLVLLTGSHYASIAAVAVLPLGVASYRVLRHERDAVALNPVLEATARLLLLYGLLFSLGWVIGPR